MNPDFVADFFPTAPLPLVLVAARCLTDADRLPQLTRRSGGAPEDPGLTPHPVRTYFGDRTCSRWEHVCLDWEFDDLGIFEFMNL
jgi:hypothetical protein